jgi:hypothetical protein
VLDRRRQPDADKEALLRGAGHEVILLPNNAARSTCRR